MRPVVGKASSRVVVRTYSVVASEGTEAGMYLLQSSRKAIRYC